MNAFDESSTNPVDLDAIDRLVAGELGEADRRQLLLKLENEPDGWRRCALAFLEDQAWRSALSTRLVTISDPLPVPTPGPSKRTQRRFLGLGRGLIAASIVGLVFSFGFVSGGMTRRTPEVQIAQQSPTKPPEPPRVIETDEVREVGWVDLVDGSSGELPAQRVPIVSGPGLDEQWLRDQAPKVSDYVRAQWERKGFEVQERRDLVTVILDDGRRVTIPLDEVAVNYVGQTPL